MMDTRSYKVVEGWCQELLALGPRDEVRVGMFILTPTHLYVDLGFVREIKASGAAFDVVHKWVAYKGVDEAESYLHKRKQERTRMKRSKR